MPHLACAREKVDLLERQWSRSRAHHEPDHRSGIIKLVSCIFTLTGALLMWQLRKLGFYSYIAGTALAIILPLIMLGNAFIGGMAAAGSTFIGVIFIVLYAVNLKQMTK